MKNKMIIFSILLILACCLSAVCAVDVNNVCDNSTINEYNENVVADTHSNNVNCEDKLGIGGNSHQNTLSYGCDDLQNLVDHSADDAILNLNHDYTLSNNKVLTINKGNGHFTINGRGHSIYLDDGLSHIESKDGIITLKNLKIIGCNKDTSYKSALCLTDSASFTLINCTFQDNVALCGGAINAMNNTKLDIKGCSFTNNFACYGGAVNTQGECIISESYFF